MRYGESLLEEVLRRTDLVQLVGRRVRLARKGRVWWGLCPFHKEKSPSFKVEHERRNYKCFGCGAGGDAFRWLMETEGLSFPESVERLAQQAGVDLPKASLQDEAADRSRKSLYEIVESAAGFFEQQLRGPAGDAARKYLAGRGLDDAACRQFRLGYAPSGRNPLLAWLQARGVSIEEAAAAGLARKPDDGSPARDFFFDRITFPIADSKGHPVAFGARALGDAKPKYINTGETPLFSKGRLLYNYRNAREAALKSGGVIVAEGYLDVIALVRAGFAAAVAPLGTALTADHLALLWRIAPEPVLSFDGDEAGQRAARRAADLALPLLKPGHSLRFAFLPATEDPDSLIRAGGPEAMRSVLGKAVPLVDMVWEVELGSDSLDTPERKAACVARLNERIQSVPAGDLRRFYLDALAARATVRLGMVVEARQERLHVWAPARKRFAGRSASPRHRAEPVSPELKRSRLAVAAAEHAHEPTRPARQIKEIEILAMMLDEPLLIERQHEILAALPFADRRLDTLRHELLNVAASGFSLETGTLEGHLVRAGMGDLVERLRPRRRPGGADSDLARKSTDAGAADVGETETRWLRAATQLRDMAEADPERARALERFKAEASDESWQDWHRLALSRGLPDE